MNSAAAERHHLMNNVILVTYATRTGTTAGVAEAIGSALAEHGFEVDVQPVAEVTSLSPYAAVVAGSAVQGNEWLPEAMQFVREHRAALSRMPFAAFMVCMTMSVKNETFRQGVRDWMQPVRALVRPVSEGYFAGALDIRKIPSAGDRLKFRVSVMAGVWSEGDHRDWEAIRAWADELAVKLAPALQQEAETR